MNPRHTDYDAVKDARNPRIFGSMSRPCRAKWRLASCDMVRAPVGRASSRGDMDKAVRECSELLTAEPHVPLVIH